MSQGSNYEHIVYTSTTVHRDYNAFSNNMGVVDFGTGYIETQDASISNTYTSAQLYADWLALLQNYWDLGNDILYPYRYRSYENNTRAAKISYYETYNQLLILGLPSPNDIIYTGEIYGAPNVTASTAQVWDGLHQNYFDCSGVGGNAQTPSTFGDYSGQNGIPLAATQWSNDEDVYAQFQWLWDSSRSVDMV